MSSTRQPERRLMPAETVYRSLRGGDRDPASPSGAALVGVRTAAALGSGAITFEQAACGESNPHGPRVVAPIRSSSDSTA